MMSDRTFPTGVTQIWFLACVKAPETFQLRQYLENLSTCFTSKRWPTCASIWLFCWHGYDIDIANETWCGFGMLSPWFWLFVYSWFSFSTLTSLYIWYLNCKVEISTATDSLWECNFLRGYFFNLNIVTLVLLYNLFFLLTGAHLLSVLFHLWRIRFFPHGAHLGSFAHYRLAVRWNPPLPLSSPYR